MDTQYGHIPVLAEPLVDMLVQNPSGVFVDATAGGGGHTELILSRLNENGRIVAMDRDLDAVAVLKERFYKNQDRVMIVHSEFSKLSTALKISKLNTIDGIIIDLGVSSYQIDTPERGFSYKVDGPLDMRMDKSQSMTAEALVNEASPEKLIQIIYRYGEERLAKPIVRGIVKAREEKVIKNTLELVEIIKAVVKHRPLYKSCARVFQALRIAVNLELEHLDEILTTAISILRPEGRFGVITYHSLEDRLVKHTFRDAATGCKCPPGLPQCVCGGKPIVTVLTKRPVYPCQDEIQANPRARSAKLRMVERLPDSSHH